MNAFNVCYVLLLYNLHACTFKTANIHNKCNKKQPAEVFFKRAVIKNLSIFTRKHLCWSLFLIKLHGFIKKKRDSNTGAFL